MEGAARGGQTVSKTVGGVRARGSTPSAFRQDSRPAGNGGAFCYQNSNGNRSETRSWPQIGTESAEMTTSVQNPGAPGGVCRTPPQRSVPRADEARDYRRHVRIEPGDVELPRVIGIRDREVRRRHPSHDQLGGNARLVAILPQRLVHVNRTDPSLIVRVRDKRVDGVPVRRHDRHRAVGARGVDVLLDVPQDVADRMPFADRQ